MIFFFTSAFASDMKMALVGSLALILPPAPCSAVRNLEWMSAGFGDGWRMRCALSRRRRKYGSWSIAHGIKQGMAAVRFCRVEEGESPQMCG